MGALNWRYSSPSDGNGTLTVPFRPTCGMTGKSAGALKVTISLSAMKVPSKDGSERSGGVLAKTIPLVTDSLPSGVVYGPPSVALND